MKSYAQLAFASFLVIASSAGVASADVFSDYEDLTEGFLGATFVHNGVTYHDVNNVSGFYPDGIPFGPTDNGDQNIIEQATLFYNDFPSYGSPNNSMTFGNTFVPGDNLSIGALASVWMDLAEPGSAASLDIGFYENGPWGNIEWRLEALSGGNVVATDIYTISDLGGRDNPTFQTLSVSGASFDQLHLYGWLNNAYTVPRGMIDNLSVTAVPEPATLSLLTGCVATTLLRNRRRGC